MSFKIYPITLGTKSGFEKSSFLYRRDFGCKISIGYYVFLVQGNGKNILIDSGSPDPELAEKLSYPKLENAVFLKDELQKLGVDCNDIDTIILTHLHWDHCFNLSLFPSAKVYVQRRELYRAVDPSQFDKYMYVATKENALPGWMTAFQQFEIIDGDHSLFDGIDVLLTPGHSPGQMSVKVKGEKTTYILASDLIPLYENYEENVPNAISYSFDESYKSIERIRNIGAVVIPGHDIKLSEIEVFE